MHHLVGIGAQVFLAVLAYADAIQVFLALFEVEVDFLLAELTDTDFIVETRHSIDLLLTVEGLGLNPAHQLTTLFHVGAVYGVDEHIGLLV